MEDEDEDMPMRIQPLRSGNPCRAYIPDDLKIHEAADVLELTEAGAKVPLLYRSWASMRRDGVRGRVRDTFLTGQVSWYIQISALAHDVTDYTWLYRGTLHGASSVFSDEYDRATVSLVCQKNTYVPSPIFLAWFSCLIRVRCVDRWRPREMAVPSLHGR